MILNCHTCVNIEKLQFLCENRPKKSWLFFESLGLYERKIDCLFQTFSLRQEQLALDLDDLCADNPWFGTLQMNDDLLRSPQLPNLVFLSQNVI